MNDAVRQPTLWDQHGSQTHLKRLGEWRKFHADHPEIYAELVRRAWLMISRGRRFGIRTLWESMRWDFYMNEPTPKPYKMNDHHAPFYSRLIMEQESGLNAIFETRGRD